MWIIDEDVLIWITDEDVADAAISIHAIKSAGIIGPIIINWSQLFMFSIQPRKFTMTE